MVDVRLRLRGKGERTIRLSVSCTACHLDSEIEVGVGIDRTIAQRVLEVAHYQLHPLCPIGRDLLMAPVSSTAEAEIVLGLAEGTVRGDEVDITLHER